mmetsp:Transcript_35290/g.38180  ORF Transcript_35290/g.38180 Transcript_35290/m.38180 type:complete len:167 (-) Transcript_35290:52-552(-)
MPPFHQLWLDDICNIPFWYTVCTLKSNDAPTLNGAVSWDGRVHNNEVATVTYCDVCCGCCLNYKSVSNKIRHQASNTKYRIDAVPYKRNGSFIPEYDGKPTTYRGRVIKVGNAILTHDKIFSSRYIFRRPKADMFSSIKLMDRQQPKFHKSNAGFTSTIYRILFYS